MKESTPTGQKLRRLFAIAFGLAAGVTAVFITAVLFYSWQSNRPKQWDRSSLTAGTPSFSFIFNASQAELVDAGVTMKFSLQNHTEEDLQMPRQTPVRVRSQGGALQEANNAFISGTVFVPAKDKAEARIAFKMACNNAKHNAAECFADVYPLVREVVLFDELGHRQITLSLPNEAGR